MKLKYIGPHAAVDLRLPSNRWVNALRHGEPIEVDAEHGMSLLKQADNWVSAETPATETPATETPKGSKSNSKGESPAAVPENDGTV